MNSTSIPVPTGREPSAASTMGAATATFARLRRRARTGIWIETLGVLGLLLVAFAVPSMLTDRSLRLEWAYRVILLASFGFVVARVVRQRLLQPLAVELSDEEMALAVERQAPLVKQALISSLQFDRELRSGEHAAESAVLKATTIDQVRTQLATIPFTRAIDGARIRRFGAGIATAAVFFGGWLAIDAPSLSLWARRNLALSNADWPRYTTLAFADAEASGVRLPQGDALTVRVNVRGSVPDQVFLDYEFRAGERGTEPMSRTGADEFTWTLDAVLGDVTLRAQGGDSLPVELAVRVVERPRIEDLVVRATFPDYMERDAEVVPATEGELRLPRGARLAISARSHKPIQEAFLLFGGEQRVALDQEAGGARFGGEFAPDRSGLLVVDVIDRDRLGAASPPRLLLRVGDDKSPTLDYRLRGIGAVITAHARIPGELKVKDDFGLRDVDASVRIAAEAMVDAKPAVEPVASAEAPFEAAKAMFGAPLPRSALRYETTAAVDLAQWNPVPDENAPQNRVRPGMLFSLRFGARDNYGPGEPHQGFGETMTFRVVTREKLVEELRRRQVEQRQELQRIAEEEQAATLEVREIASPQQAGERRKVVEARLKALARQQQTLGRRVSFVGESYQRILWEYENNRLIEQNKVRQIEGLVTEPLAALAKEAFPATSRLVDAFAGTGEETTRGSAVDGYVEIQHRIAAVLREMEQAENLAALLEELRTVIKIEDSAIQDVEKRVKEREQDVFGDRDKKNKDPGRDTKPDKRK